MGFLSPTIEAAPATPAAGNATIFVDSTSLNLCVKNSAGQINHGLQTIAPLSGQYITAINDDGTSAVTSFAPGILDLLFGGSIDTVASASTTNLGSTTSIFCDVSGITTINAFSFGNTGDWRLIRFTGALQLTAGANLVLPGAGNITTVAGDFAIFVNYGSSVYRCAMYSRKTVTGTGSDVLATSPTLVTPVIGVATGTSLAATGALSSSGTAGIGYATGAGGTVTQATSKATAFTLSKITGQITLNNAALAADTTVSAVWTNTTISATDIVVFNHVSGGTLGAYTFNAQCAAASATLNIHNVTPGSLSEAPVIQFAVIKGVTA